MMLVYHFKFLTILVISMVILNGLFGYIYVHEFGDDLLHVYFLDVAQGDAILIQTPHHQTMLIDGGPANGNVISEIGKVLPFYKRTIDVVLETHPDADHIGGLPKVLKDFSTEVFVEPGVRSETMTDNYVHQLLDEKKVEVIKARRGMSIVLDQDNHIEFVTYFPDRDVSSWKSKTNDASIVGQLRYGSSTFLFTGDSPISIENYLMKNLAAIDLKSDVLKVGHHGSRTSTSEAFLKVVNPDVAVISVGKNNRYGHPHEEVTTRLNKFHIKILRTDDHRTIKINASENKIIFDNDAI